MPFTQLKLNPALLKAIKELGFVRPTAIQAQAIPPALEGRDLIGCAQTGSGKTAAFLLPIVNRLIERPRRTTRALVLAPTRELAAQILDDLNALSVHTPVTGAAVFGGVAMGPQEHAFRTGVDVIVATPGRLIDHMRSEYARLNKIEYLVVDEADRMLDMGFLPDIKRIIALLPRERQNLLFSATFPDEIRTLAKTLLRNPAELQIAARNAVADLVTHVMHPVAREKKRELLSYLIQTRGLRQVLVFTGTRIGANRLAHQLRRDHIHADAIHGDKSQAEREAALADFKSGKTTVLVATDVASRGLDIEGLPQVINFDVPHSPEDYVHRIGRTGRAGMTGEAISLVAPQDHDAVAAIERLIKKRIERVLIPNFGPSGPSVATMMGDQPSHKDRERRRSPSSGPKRQVDPIFSKPYEPAAPAATPIPAANQEAPQAKRKRPQLAALLGGLKKAS